jgi:hypothetical protein
VVGFTVRSQRTDLTLVNQEGRLQAASMPNQEGLDCFHVLAHCRILILGGMGHQLLNIFMVEVKLLQPQVV